MTLKIDTLEIEDRNLIGFGVDHDASVYFRGRALDDEGKNICEQLLKFKKGSTVKVILKRDHDTKQGFYEVVEIEIPPREEKDRIIYRFSGRLKPVY